MTKPGTAPPLIPDPPRHRRGLLTSLRLGLACVVVVGTVGAPLHAADGAPTPEETVIDGTNRQTIIQRGPDNQKTVKQRGQHNDLTLIQEGARNASTIDQAGQQNKAESRQKGAANQSRITQDGHGNRATIRQRCQAIGDSMIPQPHAGYIFGTRSLHARLFFAHWTRAAVVAVA